MFLFVLCLRFARAQNQPSWKICSLQCCGQVGSALCPVLIDHHDAWSLRLHPWRQQRQLVLGLTLQKVLRLSTQLRHG